MRVSYVVCCELDAVLSISFRLCPDGDGRNRAGLAKLTTRSEQVLGQPTVKYPT